MVILIKWVKFKSDSCFCNLVFIIFIPTLPVFNTELLGWGGGGGGLNVGLHDSSNFAVLNCCNVANFVYTINK